MEKLKWIIIPFIYIISLWGTALRAQEVLDGIVAIVGDEIVLKTELIQTTQVYALQMGLDFNEDQEKIKDLQKDVLDNLIIEKILLAVAERDTVTVEESQVDMALESRIDEMVQQLGSKARVEAYFEKSILHIKQEYRDKIREQMIMQKIREQRNAEVDINRREVERFYQSMKDSLPEQPPRVKLRHILMEIKPGDEEKQPALKKLNNVQDRLRNGEEFTELAKEYSEDPGTASKGGDLGWIERGTLFESFEKTAFNLKPNEVSDIVETPVGLHIIQLIQKEDERVLVRHILVRIETSQDDGLATYNKLGEVRDKILTGGNFSVFARQYSDDPTTKDKGGDLGWLPLEEFQIESFKNAVDTLEIGEISCPFQTSFGYHIVKLEDKKTGGTLSLDTDYDQISGWALQRKQLRVFNAWVEELKDEMYIEMRQDIL